MTLEPQDAYVIEGMSVTLCCEATGTPPPDYYEWLGIVRETSVVQTDSSATNIQMFIGYNSCPSNNIRKSETSFL